MAVFNQVVATSIVCLVCFSIGVMYAWPSSTFQLFKSPKTPLSRPMTDLELSLFGSMSSIGGIFGTPLVGRYLDRWGRKYCAIVFSMTNVIAWTMISICNQVEIVLTAVFISGLAGALFMVVPVYVSEFCQKSIRGAMTSCSMVFYSFGMLVSYLLGGYLEYYTCVYVFLMMAVVGVGLLGVVKESPMFLMKKGCEEEAVEAIAFFRSEKVDSKEVQEEMDTIRRALNPDIDDASPEEENLKPKEVVNSRVKLSFWQFMKKSRSTRKALFVTITLCTATMFQGLIVIQVYAEPLFSKAVPNLSSTVCSVVLALVTVVSGLVAAYLSDVAGRKALMVYSSIGASMCCLVLGSQIHLGWGPDAMTAVFIYLFCVMYSCGAGTVPYIVMAEVFLPEVRSVITMLVIEWAWLCNSFVLFIYNPLVAVIGLAAIFYSFSVICILTAIFCYFMQPETKGLPVDAIQLLFVGKRRNDGHN